MSSVFERETNEFQPVDVTVDGVLLAVATGLSFAVTDLVSRPVTWTAAVVYGAKTGLWVTGMAVGTYQVWWKYVDGSETIIRRSGQIVIR